MISVIIPTQGRATLERTLRSIGWIDPETEEVIVVVDAYEMDESEIQKVMERVKVFGRGFRAMACDSGHHCYGHCQINQGIEAAYEGNYIVFNDDDDVFAPDALDTVRRVATEEDEYHLHIFRFVTPWGQVLPIGELVREGGIGGHCIVTPKVAGRVGAFTCRYNGDWDYINSTIGLWQDNVVFHDEVIAITRPRHD